MVHHNTIDIPTLFSWQNSVCCYVILIFIFQNAFSSLSKCPFELQTLSHLMLKNGQIYFKNFAVWAPFWGSGFPWHFFEEKNIWKSMWKRFEKVCEKECFDLIDLGTLEMEKNNQNEKMYMFWQQTVYQVLLKN